MGDDYASFNTYYKSLLKSFAIWDYPLTDVFTRLWLGVNKAGIFQTSQEALTKVLNTDKFGLLTDYSYAKYVQSRTCSNYDILGEGVAERSYGFGYKNNFKYRDKFSQLLVLFIYFFIYYQQTNTFYSNVYLIFLKKIISLKNNGYEKESSFTQTKTKLVEKLPE